MNCDEFTRWLDEGLPGSNLRAEAHAAECARCAGELAAARELERLLADGPPAPAANLTGRVMARVAAEPRVPVMAEDPVAWWIRAAANPACGLAALTAGLLLWRGPAFVVAAKELAIGAGARLASGAAVAGADAASLPAGLGFGLLVAAGTAAALLAFPLEHWVERKLVNPAHR